MSSMRAAQVVGYHEDLRMAEVPVPEPTEINIIGNLVGSDNGLCDPMALAARGAVTLHTEKCDLDDFQSAIEALDAGRVRGRAVLAP